MHVDWDLLARHLADTCSVEEREQFEAWLAEAPEHRAVVEGARAMIAQSGREVPAGRVAELLASLRRNIVAAETSGARPPALRVERGGDRPPIVLPLSTRRSRWTAKVKAAAALVLLIGGGAVWATLSPAIRDYREHAASADREIVATRGQRIAFPLPDGSSVVLAPDSRLRLPSDYGHRNRTVTLVGEAAFTVTHDASRPFMVYTARGVAKDLGTRFVVRDYASDSSMVVVVASGIVELRGSRQGSRPGTLLTRGQLGQVGARGAVAVRSGVDLDRYFAWTEGRLVFRDMPLGEVAAQLARWYDVEVRLGSGGLAERRLSASAQDEPADDVLRMIAVSLNLELEASKAERTYTLRTR